MSDSEPIERLVGLLAKLPGLGRRSARRAVLRMLTHPEQTMLPLAEALREAAQAVSPCAVCGNLDSVNPCAICRDPRREHGLQPRGGAEPAGERVGDQPTGVAEGELRGE